MASIGPSALGAKGCIEGLHRFAQGAVGALEKEGAPLMIKPSQPPWWAGENKPTALTGVGNAPLLPTAPPPEGEVLAPL